MNILILNWRDPKNPKSGGAEQVTLEHARAWQRAGHDVDWLAMRYSGSKREENISGIRIIRMGNDMTVILLAMFHYIFSGKRYDLIIDEIHGLPFFTPLYVRKPKIAFIHEVAGEIWDYMYYFPINKIGRFIESSYFYLYKNIRFWTDAESTIDELVQFGIKRKNCIALPCPTSMQSVKNLPVKLRIPTFIFVSRLVKMKGVEDVIDAFVIIRSKLANAQLFIVGGGDDAYLFMLQEKVKSLGIERSVIFYGKVTENKKIQLLRESHILLHASVKEGWGLVVIEAASQATPSVVYNVAGLRDSVKDHHTGIVVNTNSPAALAEESIALVQDKKRYQRYQQNALQWKNSLSWDKVTKESIELIEQTIRK